GHLEYGDPATEAPRLGDVEVWEFYNDTFAAHPMHLHLVSFEVLDRAPFVAQRDLTTGALHNITVGPRRPPADHERGPKDTVLAYPGEVTRIRARFDRPGHPARASATASRAAGSRLLVGSSSRTTLCRPAKSWARASLVFSPPDRVEAS